VTRILPAHEQHYPDKLLTHRIEEYVFDDGRPPTTNRAYAQRVTGAQVVAAFDVASGGHPTSIDVRYYVATCFHESGLGTNEWDTEVATQSSPQGFVSVGAYQIGREEALRFGFALEDMLELDKATVCMVSLAEANRRALRAYANLPPVVPDPDYTDPSGAVWIGGSMRAYLAIAHNHGLGYAKQTILKYGIDWTSYKQRNPADKIVSHGYGEDCVTGGPYYPGEAFDLSSGPRTLELRHPFMTGHDVAELQRFLKIDTDGVFGFATAAAVRAFQHAHGLVDDEIVGPKTWSALYKT
jgi:peptidoglycan hydrolase-like protein with peptidoglycan-binding domain